MSFLDQLDDLTKAESAGGGYVCKANIQFGYRVFVPQEEDVDREDTFFKVKDIGSDDERKKVFQSAKAFVEKHGFTKWNDKKAKDLPLKPFMSCHIVIKANDVLNKAVEWEDDKWITIPFFTSGWKSVMRPSIDNVGLPSAGVHHVRISYMIDPDNPKREMFNEDGDMEERDNLVAYIAELYQSLEDAVKAVGTPVDNTDDSDKESSAKDSGGSTPPEGWEWDAWKESWEDILLQLSNGATKKTVADDYGVSVSDIVSIPKS